MVFYLSLFAIAYFFSYFGKKYKQEILGYVLSFLILALVAGLRDYSVGADTYQYVGYISYYKGETFYSVLAGEYRKDMGFGLFMVLMHQFTSDPHVIFLIISCIILGTFFIAVVKSVDLFKIEGVSICLLLYLLNMYYNAGMNIVRQFMSVSICLLALIYLYKRNMIYCILLLIIAFSFHASSLIFTILPLSYMLFSAQSKLIRNGVIIVILLESAYVLLNFQTIAIYMANEYERLESIAEMDSSLSRQIIGISSLATWTLCYYLIYQSFKKKIFSQNHLYMFLLVQTLTVVLGFVAYYNVFMGRLLFYPQIALLLYQGFALSDFRISKEFKTVFILFYVALYLYRSSSGSAMTIPYSSEVLHI